nr:MAG TPA: hypothetical protein [Caudoviricetes sp.]
MSWLRFITLCGIVNNNKGEAQGKPRNRKDKTK